MLFSETGPICGPPKQFKYLNLHLNSLTSQNVWERRYCNCYN